MKNRLNEGAGGLFGYFHEHNHHYFTPYPRTKDYCYR